MFRPEAELLLACSRAHLSPGVEERIKVLLRQGMDWNWLIEQARKHYVGPLLYWNLDDAERLASRDRQHYTRYDFSQRHCLRGRRMPDTTQEVEEMTSTTQELPRNLKIGSTMTFITGMFPFLVGLAGFVYFIIGVRNPDGPWLSGQFPFGPTSYTLTEIRNFNETLGTDFVLAQHIQFANVINTGFVVMVLSIFGLRQFHKWSWFTLLAIFLWVGLNDVIALVNAGQFPVPAIAEILGLTGLFIARPAIFNPPQEP